MSQTTYLPFTEEQWRLSMSLKPLAPKDWIDIDEHFTAELALKNKLLNNNYSEVFAAIPGTQVSQKEVLDLLLEHLVIHFPQHYKRYNQTIENMTTGEVWNVANFKAFPLDLAGRLVQEDLLLMQATSKGYCLVAASLCFPLRWRLRDKLWHPMTQIHAPVPGYQEKLACPVDSLFNRIKSSHPVWRFNWSIVNSSELALTPEKEQPNWHTTITSQNVGERLFLRVERQTLRRLRVSGDILFTIRTYVYPLRVLEDTSTMAHNLAELVKQMPPEMLIYKQIMPIRELLLGYLESIE